jgi:hypothetical protein
LLQRVAEGRDASAASITRIWIRAIASHPLAYARHRLEHFNSSTTFLVEPAHRCRWETSSACSMPKLQRAMKDFVRKNALYWPCIWLALGLWLLLKGGAGAEVKALAWSGLLYGAGYLLVGVATDPRYHLWTTLSIATAAGLFLADQQHPWAALKRAAVPVGLVAAAGYAARLLSLIPG